MVDSRDLANALIDNEPYIGRLLIVMANLRKMFAYDKPPITEAVISLHLGNSVKQTDLERFAAKQKASFPRSETLMEHNFKVEENKRPQASIAKRGIRLTSKEQDRIIMVDSTQFAVIHLAPYKDWSLLFEDTKTQWKRFVGVTGEHNPKRISTRFINRIDIPIEDGGSLNLADYFAIGPSLPVDIKALVMDEFHLAFGLLDRSKSFKHMLQIAKIPNSPLIDHVSIAIDIDVFSLAVLPLKDDELWQIVYSLRDLKNDLFEACITDKTRELFR